MKHAVLLLASVAAAQTNPFANDPQAAEAGKGVFRIYCAPCHGIQAKGGRAPDLTLGTYHWGDKDADLFRVISEGVEGTEMGAFRIGDDTIWQVISYIRSTTRRDTAGVTGNPDRGSALFWGKGGCGPCHTVGSRGGRLGPDLTRVGRQRSAAHLKSSVIAPNDDVMPRFSTITVVTNDGRKIVGVQRVYDNFTVQLMDPSEKMHSFVKENVRSVTRELRSMMPTTYGKLFSPAELDDLLAYLVSLRGEDTK